MTEATLAAARAAREDALIDQAIDRRLALIFSKAEHPGVSQANTVGPHARHQLRFLLRYYAKKDHPFTSCVSDNMKRFGPNRTERVCATLKDVIRGTTHWRGHPELDHGDPGAKEAMIGPSDHHHRRHHVEASDSPPEISEELAVWLENISESDLEILFSDVQEAIA
jgi:hypothetical protein